jgi:iron(III) transport system permease protein
MGACTLGLLLAALVLYPFLRVVGGAFFSHGRLTVTAFTSAAHQPDVGGVIGGTFVIVGISSVLALVVGTFMAWLNERTDARWGVSTDALPLVPLMLPSIAGAIGWLLLLTPGVGYINAFLRAIAGAIGVHLGMGGPLNIDSWWGVIFVYMLYGIPYVFVIASAGMRNLDSTLEEQSRVCGAGLIRTLCRVTVPALRSSLAGATVLLLWFSLSLYSVPAILGPQARIQVLSVVIVNLIHFSYPSQTSPAIGLSMITIAVIGVAWLLMRRQIRSGMSAMLSGKSNMRIRIELGLWKWPARLMLLGYVFVAAVLPFIALLLVALTGFWNPHVDFGSLSLAPFRTAIWDDFATRQALLNSLELGLMVATVGMVATALVAEYVRRSRSRLSVLIDGAVKLPATLSSVVLSIGFVLAFSGSPFELHGSLLILFLAYLILYLPQGSVVSDTAASQIGKELVEASHVSGAGAARTFFRINLPLMLPGLIAGWALLFVHATGEINASVLLSTPTNNVVGAQILQLSQFSSIATMASLALALTIVSATAVIMFFGISNIVSRRGNRAKQRSGTLTRAGGRLPDRPANRLL